MSDLPVSAPNDVEHRPTVSSREFSSAPEQSLIRRRIPFLFSVRFAITAWYAGVLIFTLALLGIGLRVMLLRSLETDAERRLHDAAYDVQAQIDSAAAIQQQDETPDDAHDFSATNVKIDSLLLAGVSVTVVDTDGTISYQSGPTAALWPPLNQIQSYLVEREPTYATTRVDGYAIRGFTLPIFDKQTVDPITGHPTIVGVIFTSESLASTNRILAQLNQLLLLAGLAGGILSSFGGWTLAGRALAPVKRIMSSAEDITNDRGVLAISRRLEVPRTGDEIAQLGDTFNSMLDRIEENFTAQRRFVADASHELRTPLTSIKGNVDVLRRQLNSGRTMAMSDIVDALGDVSRETARMSRLVDDLLSLARNESDAISMSVNMDVISLDVVAQEAFRTAEVLLSGQQMTLDAPEPVTVRGDGDKLVQVMLILLDNALRYTSAEESVTLSVTQAVDPVEGTDCACVIVSDTGSGIAAEHLPHLFERFYRAEGSRARASGGTGLGLPIALSIVRAHGGWIDVASTVGEGTTFTVWLPRDPEIDDGAQPEPPSRGRRR